MICHSTCVTGFFLVIFASQASGFFGALRDFAMAGNILQLGTCSALSSFLSRHGPRTGLGLTKQCPSMLTLCLRVTFTPPMVNLKLFWVYFCFSHFCCLTLFYHFFFSRRKTCQLRKRRRRRTATLSIAVYQMFLRGKYSHNHLASKLHKCPLENRLCIFA